MTVRNRRAYSSHGSADTQEWTQFEGASLKRIGILGGMGPQATLHFYQLILDHTAASRDQDHPPAIIDSNTKVPDRTAAILSGQDNAVIKALRESAQRLVTAGAQLIAIPCNTAHAWYSDICLAADVPVLHMLEGCARHLQAQGYRGAVGLLSTAGTRETQLYETAFAPFGLSVAPISKRRQIQVSTLIEAIKSGLRGAGEREQLKSLIDRCLADGVGVVVLGCTELPLVADAKRLGWVDPMRILARQVIRQAGGNPLPPAPNHQA